MILRTSQVLLTVDVGLLVGAFVGDDVGAAVVGAGVEQSPSKQTEMLANPLPVVVLILLTVTTTFTPPATNVVVPPAESFAKSSLSK